MRLGLSYSACRLAAFSKEHMMYLFAVFMVHINDLFQISQCALQVISVGCCCI